MAQILIVYASDHDGTGRMARALAQGAETVEGCKAKLIKADEATSEDVLAADALVLGTPVHMGSMDWRVKKFIDTQCAGLWMGDKVIGKVGAVFACGSGYGGAGGGCELTMLSMLNNLAELGMVLVPLPKNSPGYDQAGLQWGRLRPGPQRGPLAHRGRPARGAPGIGPLPRGAHRAGGRGPGRPEPPGLGILRTIRRPKARRPIGRPPGPEA